MKTCPLPGCHKSLTNSYKLKLHIERFHMNIKRFQCQHCLKAFKSKDSLDRHGFKHRDSPIAVDFSLTGAKAVHMDSSRLFPIPKLTQMVKNAEDPEIRPLVHILKQYPFPYDTSMPILPPIARRLTST